jgi:hypothetical protein
VSLTVLPATSPPADDAEPERDPIAAQIPRALAGDPAAMRALLLAVAPVVLRAARRLLGRGHPDVEDVAQVALVGLVERLPTFRGESSVAHFAERIAVYRALTARWSALPCGPVSSYGRSGN